MMMTETSNFTQDLEDMDSFEAFDARLHQQQINDYPSLYMLPLETDEDHEHYPGEQVCQCCECKCDCFYNQYAYYYDLDLDEDRTIVFQYTNTEGGEVTYREMDKSRFCGEMCWLRWVVKQTRQIDRDTPYRWIGGDYFPNYETITQVLRLSDAEYYQIPRVIEVIQTTMGNFKNAAASDPLETDV